MFIISQAWLIIDVETEKKFIMKRTEGQIDTVWPERQAKAYFDYSTKKYLHQLLFFSRS